MIDRIGTDSNLPLRFEEKFVGVDPLCRFNVLAYWLGGYQDVSPTAWALALHYLTKYAQDCELTDLLETLNADRSAAGFPVIADHSAVERALSQHTEKTATFLADRLTRCTRHAQVLTLIVERETENGECQASEFINRFVDRYQVQVQPVLDRHGDAIASRCDELLVVAASDLGDKIDSKIEDIERQLSDWDSVAQPIQLLMKARGLRDTHSVEVAKRVRNVVIRLANEFGLHEQARRISSHLREVFDEVPEIAELTESDSDTLEEIIAAKEERRIQEEEYRREIQLDIMIGRDRLQINHEFIAYESYRLKLEEVSLLRWGILKSYTNGVRTSRKFTIWVGPSDHSRGIEIECVRFMESEEKILERYVTILDKLWKAVGYRILERLASKIMAGEAVAIGDATVIKTGVWLRKRKWFTSKPYFAQWEELSKRTHSGELWIGSTKDPGACVSLRLRDVDNAVILERLLDILWKDGNYAKLRSGKLFDDDSAIEERA